MTRRQHGTLRRATTRRATVAGADRHSDRLAQRLLEAESAVDAAYRGARTALEGEIPLEPAADWLLDNFYVIKQQIKEVRAGLPRAYWRKLPTAAAADGGHEPRMLQHMHALLAERENAVRIADVRAFIAAQQASGHFTLAELWAAPLMLRLALLDRVRALADEVLERLEETALAREWTERLRRAARDDPARLVLVLADLARLQPSLSPTWVSGLQRRLSDGSPELRLAMAWLDQQLALRHTTAAAEMERESRDLAAAQVAISSCIGSMRRIGQGDWSKVVEELSAVEAQLRKDPAGVYAGMDFSTRDYYRHAVEDLVDGCGKPEWEVARQALACATRARATQGTRRQQHVGYWLVGPGRAELARRLGAPPPLLARLQAWHRHHPMLHYVGTIVVLTLALAVLGIPGLHEFNRLHAVMMGVALVIAASHVSVAVVNWLTTLWVPPTVLCRMAFDDGLPEDMRTLVAVPCLLGSEGEIKSLAAALHIRQLANRDPNLYFALLADFTDAEHQDEPDDPALVRAATRAIEALNAEEPAPGAPRFCLFLRRRRWNRNERVWMGHERKRGKLADLNRFLRGSDGAMQLLVGDEATLRACRYVIVLDADTELPAQAATRLVATLAHPLNRPRVDPDSHRVVEGYGVLQPRISVGTSSESASTYARLYSDEISLDPYTHAVSDVYQDVFGEGSYVGKGIYDIDAFAATTGRRFPDNLILSHDLLEGSYARTGLVSDVEFFERHPDYYATDMRRRHRWVRGDWQILPWLLPWVPGPRGRWVGNSLSAHQRWKILDNLRRSLVPLAVLVLLIDGWLLSSRPLYWTLIGLGVAFATPLLISLRYLFKRNPRMEWSVHFRLRGEGTLRRLEQTALFVTMLPYEALHHIDAIGRSLWRMLVSRRRLLQWTPASVAARHARRGIAGHYRAMWTAPVLALFLVLGMAWHDKPASAWAAAAPFLLLWALSPWIARRISAPRTRRVTPALAAGDRAFLGAVARRTWHYFERYVDASGLPPDNHQEFPREQTARRTSPTNIGMYLASALSAWDFGYLSTPALLERLAATLDSMEQLARYRGHFFNWYDIDTLAPLTPRYVSSVDSGNLLACLLVVARGLDLLGEARLLPTQAWRGLADTWRVFVATARPEATVRATFAPLLEPPDSLPAAHARLGEWSERLPALEPDVEAEAHVWWQALMTQVSGWRHELDDLAPWLGAVETDAGSALAELADNPEINRALQLLHGADGGDAAVLQPMLDALAARRATAHALAERCRALAEADFRFLSQPDHALLAIGYNVDEQTLDAGAYDLLASEARLTVFVAIAQGRLPRKYWFALSRLLTTAGGRPALMSWSGSMFEYLMPNLVMPNFTNTLLSRSLHAVVARQIAYGRERGVPWGVSESGYNLTDAHMTYQYRAFGVPGLGLKRGLGEDLVIAPYASVLAALINPSAAARNLEALAALGALGPCGFHEALDYTPARVPDEADFALVRSYMAHHQGMALTALSAVLNEQPLQHRFTREPMFRANQILLQEKVPAVLSIDAAALRAEEVVRPAQPEVMASVLRRLDTSVPQVQLLSNGHYHVVVSQAGGGYSQCGELAINPWRGDGVCDADGIFCYVQDLDAGQLWSNAWQPLAEGEDYQARFALGSTEFERRDHGIETRTRIAVSTEDNLELRRITVTNHGSAPRHLALCSYLEWALAPQVDVASHPAFNKLFVQTEFVAGAQAVLAQRRPRSAEERPPVFVHLLATAAEEAGAVSCETRRDVFLGRGASGGLRAPRALTAGGALEGGTGAVLDPIAALRRELHLAPGASASFDLVVGVANDREAALALAERHADVRFGTRVFDLAWTRAQVVAHQLGLAGGERKIIARLASSVLYPDPAWRHGRYRSDARPGQSALWKFGISGDLPIMLVRIGGLGHMPLVQQALKAHMFWHMHGLKVDMVIWSEEASGYRQELYDRIMNLVGTSMDAPALDRAGGVFVRRGEQLSPDDRSLLRASARLILDGRHGSIAQQLPAPPPEPASAPRPLRVASPAPPAPAPELELEPLRLANGYGGFSRDGREYVLQVAAGRETPRPWCNVLGNPAFGSVISERGAAYSFAANAHEFRLTPWYNDALLDDAGEAFYLRDDERDCYWSPTPWPVPGAACITRHGFGYSRYTLEREAIHSTQTVFVAAEEPLKCTLLEVRNDSKTTRHLSVYGYVAWVLGEQRSVNAAHVLSHAEPSGSAVFARNPFNDAFADRVAFFATGEASSLSADRAAFIGRNRTLADPLGMRHDALDGALGAGLDPCAALQTRLTLAPGETAACVFVLGAGEDQAQAQRLARAFTDPAAARAELERVIAGWRERLGGIEIDTPDEATNLLVNGWLAYQTIASRLWARSGFYQSGGAYGFRDQLQDATSLLALDPAWARAQIVRAAAHQFAAGDVQHWWHPPHGRGVRTRFSDDYLWLPWALAQYLEASGDDALLAVEVPFLEGRPLSPGEESWYDFADSGAPGSIYEHARRALLHGLRYGAHGLPLMGGGDWNDGMNRLGIEGRGESVWLAFFLIDVLQRFRPVATRHGDAELAQRCAEEAEALARNLAEHAWDGAWYRRAWADDGRVIGSGESLECQIDSLPQSWAALTGTGSPERIASALDAVLERLLRADAGLLQLFDPPFDSWDLDPGYIKGYVPGIRENGGQYTHAAIWFGMACAATGRRERAWQIFQLLNPIEHSRDAAGVARYRLEPYVVAADVYWAGPHRGRGGWSWYTGSAGWMLRYAMESLLGLRVQRGYLRLQPCLPPAWPGCRLRWRHGEALYSIHVERGSPQAAGLWLDGEAQPDGRIALETAPGEHALHLILPS